MRGVLIPEVELEKKIRAVLRRRIVEQRRAAVPKTSEPEIQSDPRIGGELGAHMEGLHEPLRLYEGLGFRVVRVSTTVRKPMRER